MLKGLEHLGTGWVWIPAPLLVALLARDPAVSRSGAVLLACMVLDIVLLGLLKARAPPPAVPRAAWRSRPEAASPTLIRAPLRWARQAVFRRPRPIYNKGDMHIAVAVDAFSFPSGAAAAAKHTAPFGCCCAAAGTGRGNDTRPCAGCRPRVEGVAPRGILAPVHGRRWAGALHRRRSELRTPGPSAP